MMYGRHTKCQCLCDCGNTCVIDAGHLQNRKNPSCGCMTSYYRSLHNRTNEIGQKFGRLTIIDINYNVQPTIAVCQCDCGNIIQANKADVVSGHTSSCGCLQKENTSAANLKDFSGITSSSGVMLVDKSHKNESGVWMWNCICPLCGKSFVALPAKVLSNHTTSCGCKIQSSRERIIENILKEENIHYEKQKRFADCKFLYTLPFDFAVYDNNQKLLFLIEYDGQQHFRPVDFFGGKKGYEDTKIRDNIKDNYCKENNIRLIRLNYQQTEEQIQKTIINAIYP